MRRENHEPVPDYLERERLANEQGDLCRAEQNRRNAEAARWNAEGGADKAARALLDRLNLPPNHRDPQGRFR